MKPNLHTFGTMITAWGRSKRRDSAVEAQAVFDDLMTLYRSGDRELKPGIVIYNALIDAWAKSGSVERAEQILRDLDSNPPSVKPNVITYGAIVKGWSVSGHSKAADRVQSLYDEMKRKYQAGDQSVKPNERILELVVSTWLRSPRSDRMVKLRGVLDDVQERYKSGEVELQQFLNRLSAAMNNG
jgi:pentatricopeptide repeat protein